MKKVAAGAFAAFTIASSAFSAPAADASDYQMAAFSSSNVISEKVTRQGLYKEYDVDVVQDVDDATSTFKSAKETKTKKGKCEDNLLAILSESLFCSYLVALTENSIWIVSATMTC